jgi:hypothetical protein
MRDDGSRVIFIEKEEKFVTIGSGEKYKVTPRTGPVGQGWFNQGNDWFNTGHDKGEWTNPYIAPKDPKDKPPTDPLDFYEWLGIQRDLYDAWYAAYYGASNPGDPNTIWDPYGFETASTVVLDPYLLNPMLPGSDTVTNLIDDWPQSVPEIYLWYILSIGAHYDENGFGNPTMGMAEQALWLYNNIDADDPRYNGQFPIKDTADGVFNPTLPAAATAGDSYKPYINAIGNPTTDFGSLYLSLFSLQGQLANTGSKKLGSR